MTVPYKTENNVRLRYVNTDRFPPARGSLQSAKWDKLELT